MSASMRPQSSDCGKASPATCCSCKRHRFNEAAVLRLRKVPSCSAMSSSEQCFNEAAVLRLRKERRPLQTISSVHGFNEAAVLRLRKGNYTEQQYFDKLRLQ